MPSELRSCLICYPYYSSKHTGRGHDRYIFELSEGIKRLHPDLGPRLLHQGFSKSMTRAALKQPRLIADLLRTKADLYHAMSPIGGATAAILRKHPLVVIIHDLVPFHYSGEYDNPIKYKYYRICTRICAKKSDAVIVPYEVTKRELIERFKLPESKIHVVNYGVDHATYFPRNSKSRGEKATKTILYIGEVSRSKGVDALLRAYSIVEQKMDGVELVIGGKKSKDKVMLDDLAQELCIKRVTFLGYVPEEELPQRYSSADVMVYPSRAGFGLSTLEAMSCGTPVVVGATLDAPEFVSDAGVLVDPDDTEQMAQAILKTISDVKVAEQLSAKAVERAKSFSWENTANGTAGVYREILSNR